MNCETIQDLILEGKPLPPSAQDHLAECPVCQVIAQPVALATGVPDNQVIADIQAKMGQSLRPVRALPSDRTLVLTLVVFFIAFSAIAALPFGYNGFHVLTGSQKLVYYALLCACAVLFALASVKEMIPASKLRVNPALVIVGTILAIALLVSVLFQNFDLQAFVKQGTPCLRMGSLCALVGGALAWFFFRRGFFVAPVAAAATIGFFAGLAGVAALALHCPIENSAHIIVWHLGAMFVGGVAGACLALVRQKFAA